MRLTRTPGACELRLASLSWRFGWSVLLALCSAGAAVARVAPFDPVGTWQGTAWLAGAPLELRVRFFRAGSELHATLSCRDMMLLEEPLDSVRCREQQVRFSTADEHALRFTGVWDGDSLRGTAVVPVVPGVTVRAQAGPTLSWAFGRAPEPAGGPYATRDVRIASGTARLAGTLYVPRSPPGAHAGIVLLQGSSSNRRAEARFHADLFARSGLEVLVFDKRGNGESTGDYATATYDSLAADAAAAIRFLRLQPGVDARRVGLWGLSQGAFIAPLVAARLPDLAFIVALSAPGMPIGVAAAYQDSMRLSSAGFDAADVRRAVSLDWRLNNWLSTGKDQAELGALLDEAGSTRWRRASSLPARLPVGRSVESWYWRGRMLDPLPGWQAVKMPVLLLYGAADELVPARASARAIEHALLRGGNHDVTLKVFPAANHVLRTLPQVAAGKWDWPRAAPGYLDLVTQWIAEHTR